MIKKAPTIYLKVEAQAMMSRVVSAFSTCPNIKTACLAYLCDRVSSCLTPWLMAISFIVSFMNRTGRGHYVKCIFVIGVLKQCQMGWEIYSLVTVELPSGNCE